MFEPEIIRIPILPLGMVNAHVVRSPGGCSGGRRHSRLGAEDRTRALPTRPVVRRHQADRCKLCMPTTPAVQRECTPFPAPILAHQADAGFYIRKRPMTFCPTGLVGGLFIKTPLPHQPHEGFVPDILMRKDNEMQFSGFGVDGVVRHTAGQTPGSLAVELPSHDGLIGDLVEILIGGVAFTAHAIRPPFEDDPA